MARSLTKGLLVTLLLLLGVAAIAYGRTSQYKVEISINRESLKSDFYEKTGRFFVDTRVRNISKLGTDITVWSQYGSSWTSNSSEIFPGKEAAQNIASTVTLKPGQEYSGEVEMISDPHNKKTVTFRLGFVAKGDAWGDSIRNQDVTWSNSVTLTRQ